MQVRRVANSITTSNDFDNCHLTSKIDLRLAQRTYSYTKCTGAGQKLYNWVNFASSKNRNLKLKTIFKKGKIITILSL